MIITVVVLQSGNRKEVMSVEYLNAFLISVMASVVGYYICKWLDGNDEDDD